MKLEILKFNKKLIYTFLFVLGLAGYANSQNEEIVSIQWGESKILTQGDNSIVTPVILGQEFIGQIPNYFWSKKVENNDFF